MGDIVRLVRRGRFIGWYVRYKDANGRRRMRASHQPSKELARRYLLEIEGRVARGLLGIPEPEAQAPTFAELCERFLGEYRRPRIKDIDAYRRTARTALRRALALIGKVRIDALGRSELERVRATLGNRHAQNSVRVTLALVARVLSWAHEQKLVKSNAAAGLELPAAQRLIEYLSRAEVQSLLNLAEAQASAGEPLAQVRYVCLALALTLGLRKGELFGLRWSEVDLDARRLTVARSYRSTPKGGSPRHLRIPATLVPILMAWQRDCPRTSEGLVCPIPGRAGARMGHHRELLGLGELLAAAGCKPLQRAWHALRHTFASHYIMRGGNLLALQKMLGHASIEMTLIYSHLAPDYLADEAERVDFLFPETPALPARKSS